MTAIAVSLIGSSLIFGVPVERAECRLNYSVRGSGMLIDVGLVEKVEQWWWQNCGLLLAPEENQEAPNEAIRQKKGDCGQETSKLGASKAHSSVPIQKRDFTEQQGVSINRNENGTTWRKWKRPPNLSQRERMRKPFIRRSLKWLQALIQKSLPMSSSGLEYNRFAMQLVPSENSWGGATSEIQQQRFVPQFCEGLHQTRQSETLGNNLIGCLLLCQPFLLLQRSGSHGICWNHRYVRCIRG